MGVIKVAAAADLILLEKDPLQRIDQALSIAGVAANGVGLAKTASTRRFAN